MHEYPSTHHLLVRLSNNHGHLSLVPVKSGGVYTSYYHADPLHVLHVIRTYTRHDGCNRRQQARGPCASLD